MQQFQYGGEPRAVLVSGQDVSRPGFGSTAGTVQARPECVPPPTAGQHLNLVAVQHNLRPPNQLEPGESSHQFHKHQLGSGTVLAAGSVDYHNQ
jgi:hypothetical protein